MEKGRKYPSVYMMLNFEIKALPCGVGRLAVELLQGESLCNYLADTLASFCKYRMSSVKGIMRS